ncbi:hypothetical protein [Priestia koreensis]|uniref:Uncharacterized protein n=1 Tax=Priestia koreensis TaxID=284581 RepID=A0A0M0KSY3_9BACI|nr:hypothetical protein [Priestia koreensis]KOO41939.1 hypothetical protein AMD01_18850 [Priestia koreensis]MCM3003536.1 hypothetical protein [Priestia koreensis]UNL86327.1 hypothetical protein IE339_07485 [Priestia koreensis]
MDKININPDLLGELALKIQGRERQAQHVLDILEWNYELLRAMYPEVEGTRSGEIYQSFKKELLQYLAKFQSSFSIVKTTEREFRELDQ